MDCSVDEDNEIPYEHEDEIEELEQEKQGAETDE